MNHFKLSIVKSLIRILCCLIGCVLIAFNNTIVSILTIACGLSIAEILGILEEVFDKRKEQ